MYQPMAPDHIKGNCFNATQSRFPRNRLVHTHPPICPRYRTCSRCLRDTCKHLQSQTLSSGQCLYALYHMLGWLFLRVGASPVVSAWLSPVLLANFCSAARQLLDRSRRCNPLKALQGAFNWDLGTLGVHADMYVPIRHASISNASNQFAS